MDPITALACSAGAAVVAHTLWRDDMFELEGQVALITGAGSGLGRAIALELARHGARLVLWGRRSSPLETVADEAVIEIRKAGREIHRPIVQVVDVGDASQVSEAIETVGRVDVLVNNAGIHYGPDSFFQRDPELTEQIVRTNLLASFWTLRAILPGMVKRDHGRIICISSAAGMVGVAGMADYCATKFGLRGMNEALRMQLRKSGSNVRCTLVAPSYIDTGMFDGVDPGRIGKLFMPMLTTSETAKAIIHDARQGQEEFQAPWIVRTADVLRGALPTSSFDFISQFLGVQGALDSLHADKRVVNPSSKL